MLMLCPICANDYDGIETHCPVCDFPLVPGQPGSESAPRETPQRGQPFDFVELCRPRVYPVAMLIKDTMEKNGIPTLVQGGYSLSVMPHLVFGGELRVMVDSRQIEYARALYTAYFESEGNDYFPQDEE